MPVSFLTQQSLSKSAFFRQNSERRNFKLLDTRKLSRDGTGSPLRTSPPSTPSSPDDTFFNLGDLQNGRKKREEKEEGGKEAGYEANLAKLSFPK